MMGPAAATPTPSACAPEESVWYVHANIFHFPSWNYYLTERSIRMEFQVSRPHLSKLHIERQLASKLVVMSPNPACTCFACSR